MMNPLEDDSYNFQAPLPGSAPVDGPGTSLNDPLLSHPANGTSPFDNPFASTKPEQSGSVGTAASAAFGSGAGSREFAGFSSASSMDFGSQNEEAEDEDGEGEESSSSLPATISPAQPRVNPFLQPRQTSPCCNIDRILVSTSKTVFNPLLNSGPPDQQPVPAVTIEEAHKTSEGGGSYITYVIRTNIPSAPLHLESRHRYSDFESLQRLLRKVHPTVVVPPVPDKHSMADYATRPGKAKDDPKIIEQRKRMLQSFLNRVLGHPVLSREHVVHRFLEPGNTWSEILATSGLAQYMKKKDKGAGLKLTDSLLKNPDPHFLASEEYTFKFGQQLGQIVKYHKRISKHFGELANTGSDLGAAYNGWSLMETQGPMQSNGTSSSFYAGNSSLPLSHAIESIGEAVDTTVSATSQLNQALELRATEYFAEYEKLTTAIEGILKWRHALHVEYESVTEGLINKRATLGRLESSEAESQRLAAVLHSEGVGGRRNDVRTSAIAAANALGLGGDPEAERSTVPAAGPSSPTAGTSTISRSSSAGGGGILATLNSFIDNDPEATRRANITKTRDKIQTLEVERERGLAELGSANEAIQRDLDRFQRDKVHDVRNLLLSYAVAMRDYNRKAATAWAKAKEEIAKVSLPPSL
ncbi:hypothetical protein DFJ73DRAFT_820862 [Zopfochytrium polystomum]|nr:hypothetical protein DFJ73DRAFT_820862 [Zopfochytrium polystomum]